MTSICQSYPRLSRGLMGFGVAVAFLLLVVTSAYAFNPPVDTAGPLTVKIEGPQEVTQAETPVPVRVVLENKGDAAVQGTLDLKLIDAWWAEPAEPVKFSVDGRGSATVDFTIIAGQKTYDVLYPIHAFARFEVDGKPLVAHPVLVFEAKIADKGEKSPWHQMELAMSQMNVSSGEGELPWQAFRVASDSPLAVWQIPVHRGVLEVFGQKPMVTSVGWKGSEPQSRGFLGTEKVRLGDVAHESIVIHPPWYEGRTGTMLVEFPLELPKTTPIRLEFANAMQQEGQSDGVTFRVRVLPLDAPAGQFGEVVFERHIDAKTWQPGQANLSRFAGQAVRVQLESHPGPKNNTGCDRSYWAEPTLVAGTPAAPPAFPPASDKGSQVLGTIRRGDQQFEVRLWPGKQGLLDSAVGLGSGEKRLVFRGFHVRVLGTQLDDPRSPIILEKVIDDPTPDGRQIRHQFRSLLGNFDVVGRLFVEQGVLRAKFRLENAPAPRPWLAVHLEDVAARSWNQSVAQIYAGAGNVIRKPVLFDGPFEGHALSTSFIGVDFDNGASVVQGVDVPPTGVSAHPDVRHCSLHAANDCQLTFIPTQNVWEGARTWHDANGLKAAGGVETAAGRFVFDLWGGDFVPSAKALRRAFRYGLTDSMVVWHDWQRWGYDYRLPETFPPNAKVGTVEEMRELVELCKEAGVLFAPHDNYVDFYPDAEGFSYEKIVAFSGKDKPVRAWLNQGRGAQSYRYRADAIEQFLRPNVDVIRENLAPTAYFIDVWSSLSPYSYWTPDGQFFNRIYTRDVLRNQFAWIREQLGGKAPQISESGHDQLIGYLDGAQTNHLRVGFPLPGKKSFFLWPVPCEDAERTPWFDAAHHDRFVLHGAGYSSRYEAGLDGRLHGIYSDDYMTTEVLTGHPAMVSSPFGHDVVRKYWLSSDLMRALALRRIESVEYAEGNLHQQHVRWSGGGEVWANRGEDDWNVAGTVLPPFGFLARVKTDQGTVEAVLCRRNGVITESASSPDRLYVNGRQVDGSSKEFAGDQKEAYLARLNPEGKAIDFGPLVTSGGCRLSRDGQCLLVTPLPQSEGPAFSVALRWSDSPWKLPEPTKVEAVDEEGKTLSTKPIQRDGNTLTITCEPGVFQYRLTHP